METSINYTSIMVLLFGSTALIKISLLAMLQQHPQALQGVQMARSALSIGNLGPTHLISQYPSGPKK